VLKIKFFMKCIHKVMDILVCTACTVDCRLLEELRISGVAGHCDSVVDSLGLL
jgi:hypothetical protein